MLRSILVAVLFIGCARPELVAFPQTPDSADPPSASTDDPTPTAPAVLRTRFSAHASTAQINRTACTLQPTLVVAGAEQKVDMRIGGVTPCSSEGSVRINAFVSIASDGHGREVVLELPVPTGATTQDTNDLKLGLREVRTELEHRLASLPSDVFPVVSSETQKQKPRRAHRPSSRVLTVAETLLISGGVVGVAGAVMFGGGFAACCGNDGWILAGFTALMAGAAPPVFGGIVTLIVAGALYAGED